MVEDLTHGFDLREDFGVFIEDGLEIFWDLEGAGVLVVDRPVALRDCQAVELLEGELVSSEVVASVVDDRIVAF